MNTKITRTGFHRGTPTIKITCTMNYENSSGIATATVTEDQIKLYASSAVLTIADWWQLSEAIDLAATELHS